MKEEKENSSEPRERASFSEICELCVLGAVGWLFGLWVWKGLSVPLAPVSAVVAVVLLWVTFGFGGTLRRGARILAVGGGWFLLFCAGPLALVNWLVLWIVPTASRERLGIVLSVIAAVPAVILFFLSWMKRGND